MYQAGNFMPLIFLTDACNEPDGALGAGLTGVQITIPLFDWKHRDFSWEKIMSFSHFWPEFPISLSVQISTFFLALGVNRHSPCQLRIRRISMQCQFCAHYCFCHLASRLCFNAN
jgi:hypothetical protein